MKPNEIKVGKTYVNRGAGRTRRTVTAITSETFQGEFVYFSQPIGSGVRKAVLGLGTFAAWAGKEVE